MTATEVKLPRLGQGMESGTIVRWLKAEGDAVKKREPLYELDTDKVTQEVESDVDGILLKIVVAEGEVEVGSTIAMIGRDGDDVTAAAEPPSRRPMRYERGSTRSGGTAGRERQRWSGGRDRDAHGRPHQGIAARAAHRARTRNRPRRTRGHGPRRPHSRGGRRERPRRRRACRGRHGRPGCGR